LKEKKKTGERGAPRRSGASGALRSRSAALEERLADARLEATPHHENTKKEGWGERGFQKSDTGF